MDERTIEKISNLDNSIRYWKGELGVMKGRSSHRDKCLVIFGDDFAKVNGYYKRAHIPSEVAYEIVLEKLVDYIEKLKEERERIVSGKKPSTIKILRTRIPFLNQTNLI